MRVLFVASPMVGHVLPLLPLARAFCAAGHEVLLGTGPEGMSAARSGGLEVRDVAPGLTVGPSFGKVALRHPVLAVRGADGRDRGTRFVGMLFAGLAARMVDGVGALAEEWAPDLVVQEPFAVAGGVVAAFRRVPVALVNMTLFDAEELFASTVSALGSATRVPPPAEVLNLAPAGLVEPASGRPLRFVPEAGGNTPAPPDLTRPGERPRIVVSRSTVADPRPDRLMSNVVAAAADADVDVVLARPDKRVAGRPLPANVRATDWLPFPAVFPAAAGAVHHGGAGTLLTALTAGIPQLLVPGAGDRRVNGELLARSGAGLAVPVDRITARDLERLATDDALAAAARVLAAQIAAMPDPAEVIDDLVALTR
ncbi:UDP:flavonoid glycosyltransferase YjiC (YdhE family) [Blastococcus colisei]|uniref:UDP:flavonoid glycosyltransferase YjiC (YdhE family) n=1 Tax=Blastococcus colisei TaxID=1564162 RepID=A0A543PHL5_9ACTN|nr:glycosyltransferase [Blastococcus colisei]TQN43576.1 UDP:flavonoid glycosyltransferase YjiC (YdhE family) [Blastococcus colisei]